MQGQDYRLDNEMTIKELVLKGQDFLKEISKSWKLILFLTVPIVIYFLYTAIRTEPTYTANLTFMVNEDDGGGFGGVSAILGQFGFGSGGGGDYNLDKIVELSRSRKLISMAIFEEIEIDKEKKLLANYIIDKYNYHEVWKNDNRLKDFYFNNHDTVKNFSRIENTALKIIHQKLVGPEGILSIGYKESTGILNITTISIDESLSIALTEILYNKLKEFYITKTVGQQETTYNNLRLKTTSLERQLKSANYALLKFQDQNRGLSLRQYETKRIELEGEVTKLASSYAESYKNLQLAEFSLNNATPFITAIDEPIVPLQPIVKSKIKSIVIGSFVGVFLSILFIVVRKLFQDIMQ